MFLLVMAASAASLDNIEIGGPWGSPTTTDASAGWWNPAGWAAGQGTRVMVEGAPTFASLSLDRAAPHGGEDTIALKGVVPFAGVATDMGVKGLGLGLVFALPFVHGGAETSPPGSGSYALRSGAIQSFYLMGGGGWTLHDTLSLGLAMGLLHSSWSASLDNDTLPLLQQQIEALGETADYTDADLENPDYAATLNFSTLQSNTVAFSAGFQWLVHPKVRLGAAYVHGGRVEASGPVDIVFGCPPTSDTKGRYGAESYGICDTTLQADSTIGYSLPDRVQGGVQFSPRAGLHLEAMGAWVRWHVFDDYDITIANTALKNDLKKPETATLIDQDRQWARENRDSVWGALDAKGDIGIFTLGGRLTYDMAAIPDIALSSNNYDANDLFLSALGAVRPWGPLEFGLSYTHHFLQSRTVTDSGFGMTLGENRLEDRWYYPHGNGTYRGSIDRIGVQLRMKFD